jgi:hypothetical protein
MTLAGIPGPPMRKTIGEPGVGLVDLSRMKAIEMVRPVGCARDSGTVSFPSSASCDCPS